MSKILILTSSPQRDKFIDDLLKEELERLGNEVYVRPLYSVGYSAEDSVLELEPDVMVVPPIRNAYAFHLSDTVARWGVGVVVRHTEPSCDKKDLEFMSERWRLAVIYERPWGILFELMWGIEEARHVKRTLTTLAKPISVGAFVADAYKNPEIIKSLQDKDAFCKKYGLDPSKKTVLVSSPWGLLDMESDAKGGTTDAMLSDREAQAAWLVMVKDLKAVIGEQWNILTTIHPGLVNLDDFNESLCKLDIPLDSKSPAIELLVNCDALIHSGSTMAVEMHWLDKPAFQFGDVNSLKLPDGNWRIHADSTISRVSPFFLDGKEIAKAVLSSEPKSNASAKSIKELEEGRYGSMDGNATKRAAMLINIANGKFKRTWPVHSRSIGHPYTIRDYREISNLLQCSFCGSSFVAMKREFLALISRTFRLSSPIVVPDKLECPCCGYMIGIVKGGMNEEG